MTRLGKNSRNKYDTIKCTNRKCDCVSAPIYLVEQSVLDSMRKWLSGYIYHINQQDLSPAETDNSAEKTIAELTDELKKSTFKSTAPTTCWSKRYTQRKYSHNETKPSQNAGTK